MNGINYLKNILLSTIKFSNDFQKISFDEKEIYEMIKRDKEKGRMLKKNTFRKLEHKNSLKQFSKITKILKKNSFIRNPHYKKTSYPNINNSILEELKINKDPKQQREKKKISFSNNNSIGNLYKTNKKIISIHSNQNMRNMDKNNIKDEKSIKKEVKYTEYYFIWETPSKTYQVKIIMPIIFFWSEHIKKNILTFCNKDLYLFLLENNFINWDYYLLNYLFSIKTFRQIISSGLSFYSINNISNINLFSFTERKKMDIHPIFKNIDKSLFSFVNDKTIILNNHKKIYNQLNEKNESYRFFSTDNYNINSIINFHSFHIFVEYDKLNSKVCWEFVLNFKQMKYLAKINKYEPLETFLPKIIKTNFEEGVLSMDFSIFEQFNEKILDYRRNNGYENFKTTNALLNINLNHEINLKKKNYGDMNLVI